MEQNHRACALQPKQRLKKVKQDPSNAALADVEKYAHWKQGRVHAGDSLPKPQARGPAIAELHAPAAHAVPWAHTHEMARHWDGARCSATVFFFGATPTGMEVNTYGIYTVVL